MVYLDTSSLLKLIWQERESEPVAELIGREALVLVSSLTELESRIQITAAYLAGAYSRSRSRRLRSELDNLLKTEPFERRPLSGDVFEAAQTQHTKHGSTTFCRTLDRLHLAAMEELAVIRLVTNDLQQANAARALGFTVEIPN
jgi:predicted nucleic acid-binding protein